MLDLNDSILAVFIQQSRQGGGGGLGILQCFAYKPPNRFLRQLVYLAEVRDVRDDGKSTAGDGPASWTFSLRALGRTLATPTLEQRFPNKICEVSIGSFICKALYNRPSSAASCMSSGLPHRRISEPLPKLRRSTSKWLEA